MKILKVCLGSRSYNILIGRRILRDIDKYIKGLNIGIDAFVIANRTTNRLFGYSLARILKNSGFSVRTEEVPDNEKSKSQEVALRLISRITKYDVKKRLFIIALGGGVVGDLAGFIASIYKRGIPYIQVHTTLLAQVDSAIGGKTAIDLEGGKNLVGAFYQPRLVLSDIDFLSTLSKRHLISGLAEVIKYAVIKDPKLFRHLEKEYLKILKLNKDSLEYIVYNCSKIKAMIVEQDEKETKGLRTILNFGHTIGHAIEAAAGYKTYTHGEAIAIGMIAASRISCKLNILDSSIVSKIEDLINKVGLPTRIDKLNLSGVLKAFYHDKKFIHGRNRLVLPKRIGQVIIYEDVPIKLIKEVLINMAA